MSTASSTSSRGISRQSSQTSIEYSVATSDLGMDSKDAKVQRRDSGYEECISCPSPPGHRERRKSFGYVDERSPSEIGEILSPLERLRRNYHFVDIGGRLGFHQDMFTRRAPDSTGLNPTRTTTYRALIELPPEYRPVHMIRADNLELKAKQRNVLDRINADFLRRNPNPLPPRPSYNEWLQEQYRMRLGTDMPKIPKKARLEPHFPQVRPAPAMSLAAAAFTSPPYPPAPQPQPQAAFIWSPPYFPAPHPQSSQATSAWAQPLPPSPPTSPGPPPLLRNLGLYQPQRLGHTDFEAIYEISRGWKTWTTFPHLSEYSLDDTRFDGLYVQCKMNRLDPEHFVGCRECHPTAALEGEGCGWQNTVCRAECKGRGFTRGWAEFMMKKRDGGWGTGCISTFV